MKKERICEVCKTTGNCLNQIGEKEVWIEIMGRPVHFDCANIVIEASIRKPEIFKEIYPSVGIFHYGNRRLTLSASMKFESYLLFGIRPLPPIQKRDLILPNWIYPVIVIGMFLSFIPILPILRGW
jgi:hypothetical protein